MLEKEYIFSEDICHIQSMCGLIFEQDVI